MICLSDWDALPQKFKVTAVSQIIKIFKKKRGDIKN
jgi:hypothetical protein